MINNGTKIKLKWNTENGTDRRNNLDVILKQRLSNKVIWCI